MDSWHPPSWVTATIELGKQIKEIFIVPLVIAVWTVVQKKGKAKERREEREAAFITIQTADAATLRVELTAERSLRQSTEKERDHFKLVMGGWYDVAQEAKHDFNNLATMTNGVLTRAGLPLIEVTEMLMPRDFDKPYKKGGLPETR